MTLTENLGMRDPTVGADSDQWGNILNANLDLIDEFAGNVSASVLSNLPLSTAGSSATFTCGAGVAGSTDGPLMALTFDISKTTSAWAVGTATGALDTGSIVNNTWYHVWLIKRPDTGVVDVLVSLAPLFPSMPTNYTLKRRIGALRTNGSGQWRSFVQRGDLFLWVLTTTNDINSAPTTSPVSYVVNVPTGVNVIAKMRGWCQTGASESTNFLLYSPLDTGISGTNTSSSICTCLINAGAGSIATTQGFSVDILTDTSAQVNLVAGGSVSVSSLTRAQAYGWIDPRGKW